MPITLDQYIAHATTIGANEKPIFVRNDQFYDSSAFSRLRSNAQTLEKRTAINEFLHAIQEDPKYAQYINAARSIFDVSLACGDPLTSKEILWAKDLMDARILAQNSEVGRQFAGANGVLPRGFGTDFAKFCARHDAVLENAQDARIPGLIKDFIKAEILPQHVAKMCRDRQMPDEAPQIATLLQNTGVMERALDHAMDNHGLQDLHFADIMQIVTDQSALSFDILQQLHAADMPDGPQRIHNPNGDFAKFLRADAGAQILHALTEGVQSGRVPLTSTPTFCVTITEDHLPVDSPAARSDAIRAFLLKTEGAGMVKPLLLQRGLPENLAAAFGRHPTIMADAQTRLNEAVPPPAVPMREQAQEALRLASEDFLARNEPAIREFVVMATDPPVQLVHRPLNADSLPVYINALLEAQTLLQPLFDDTIPDAAFMTRIVDYAKVLSSCSHGAAGGFAADEALTVHGNVVRLMLAVNGQKPNLALLEKVVKTFAPLASEFMAVGDLISAGRLDLHDSQPLLQASMNGHRMLETMTLRLISDLPPNTLKDMGIKGETQEKRMFNFMLDTFQKETPFAELSDRFRSFATSMGVPMPPLAPAVQANLEARALFRARQDTLNEAVAEFFPSGSSTNMEENPVMFYTAFDEAAKHADLTGLDPDKINGSNLYPKARQACAAWMAEHLGRPINVEELRPVIMASIAEDLQVMKGTLDAVDAMNEVIPQGAIGFLRAFPPEEKTIIKDMVMATGMRDIALITELAVKAKDLRRLVHTGMRPYNMDMNVLRMLDSCLTRVQGIHRYLAEHPGMDGNGALDGMLRMLIPLSGATVAERQSLFNSLSGPLGQSLAGGIMYAVNRDNGQHGMGNMVSATRIMGLLREQLGASLGIEVEQEPFFFAQAAAHINQISSETMDFVNRFSADVFSGLEVTLASIRPALNAQDWNTLASIGRRLVNSGQGMRNIERLLHGNAPALLAAHRANGGELSPSQIWRAVTGKKAPSPLEEANFSARLYAHTASIYKAAVAKACPNLGPDRLELQVESILGSGVSFPKLMALVKPHSKLNMNEITRNLNLSDLTNYGPENAFGLVTDFHRRHAHTTMRLESPDQPPFETHPFMIPAAENVPTHPHFVAFMAAAGAISQSEAQKAVVLQSFSQASLGMPHTLSLLFPGVQLDEHGSFSVTATKHADNSVIVNIHSDPTLPLKFHEQFVIQIDGTSACTKFSMERR